MRIFQSEKALKLQGNSVFYARLPWYTNQILVIRFGPFCGRWDHDSTAEEIVQPGFFIMLIGLTQQASEFVIASP